MDLKETSWEGMGWSRLAEDRDKLGAMVMNLGVSTKFAEYLE